MSLHSAAIPRRAVCVAVGDAAISLMMCAPPAATAALEQELVKLYHWLNRTCELSHGLTDQQHAYTVDDCLLVTPLNLAGCFLTPYT
jgi:hypothetical protein